MSSRLLCTFCSRQAHHMCSNDMYDGGLGARACSALCAAALVASKRAAKNAALKHTTHESVQPDATVLLGA